MESNASFDKLGIQRIEVRTHRPCRRITSAITPMTETSGWMLPQSLKNAAISAQLWIIPFGELN